MSEYIPYGRQWLDEEDIYEVIEVLRGEYLTTGPKIKEFESKIAEFVGSKYAVAISSGTAALHAACAVAEIGAGDEIITSAITFPSCGNCALFLGAKPVFADINPRTYNIDPKSVIKKITKKTKALMPVHFAGQPCEMDELIEIAKEHNLIIIEDGTHAFGAKYKNRKIGSIGEMTVFSFHPVKHITTGEGGAITTNDEVLYNKMLMFRTHGITRDRSKLTKDDGPWYYEQQFLGYNYRMMDVQAAMGISQLKKIGMFLEKRLEYANIYNEALKDIEEIEIPYQLENTESAWLMYLVKLKLDKLKVGRKVIFSELLKKNIGVYVHYMPVYYHPYYKELKYKRGSCKNAEEFYECEITLPLYPKMTKDNISYVIENFKEVIKTYSKKG